MRVNVTMNRPRTHEGAPAARLSDEQLLRRAVLSCLLFESEFYEDGQEIAKRIDDVAARVAPETVADLAVEARHRMHLRHVPLLLLRVLARTGAGRPGLVADTIERVISRADELGEFVALYWRDGKRPLSAQVKKGLARAARKFDSYQLAKYNRDAPVKLRDVLFMVHAKPKDEAQAETWRKLVDGALESPDTWEVALSAGADKRETFARLLRERKLGYMALLRNLRNMTEAGVDADLIREAVVARRGADRVLPFRYVAAARACPQMEPWLDQALSEAIAEMPLLPGRTVILVDVSSSMTARLSRRSDLTRMDAAATLGAIVPGDVRLFTFSDQLVEVPPRRGMAGVDVIVKSQPHCGTRLFDAVAELNGRASYDRLIIVTDEQATDPSRYGHWIQGSVSHLPDPTGRHGYMVNVASARNGVGYGRWTHIDGFSESVLRFVHEHERARAD